MAGEQTAARRYAQAVFDIAEERNSHDQWLIGLDAIVAFVSEPGAVAVLESDKAPFDDKAALVERALADSDTLAVNLAKLLVRKKRTALAPLIARMFREMDDARRGISHALVRSAVALSAGEQEAVRDRLSAMTGTNVVLRTEVDPELIGGIVARIGDRVLDGSTRTKLIQLRRRLQQAAG